MDENLGQATFRIIVDTTEAQRQLGDFQVTLSDMTQKSTSETKTMSAGFSELTSSIGQLATTHLALSGTASAIGDVVDSFNQYQASMNGVKAVANGLGNSISQSISAVQELSSSGLLSQAEAAEAMKNLQAYGYSVSEATELIKIMTDAAVYNRQANYSLGEAVVATAQGIRTENSVLSDASGIQKNIAKMYEEYAASLGKATNALTDLEKRQAVMNGFMAEGGIYAGNAAEYSNTLAGAQQKLDTSIEGVKQTMGSMFNQFAPIINGMANWINNNKELVAIITTTIGILAGVGGMVAAITLGVKALKSISKAMNAFGVTSKIAQGGILGLVGAVAGLGATWLVTSAMDNMTDSVGEVDTAFDAANPSIKSMESNVTQLGTAMADTAEQIAKLEKQLTELERDFRRDLKQISVNHEESLANLNKQIEEANIDYRRAIDERTADFNVTMAKQERSHQETVDELMTQLNFLQRYNNDYNKQKLAQVQFALEKEKHLYQQETLAQEEEIRLQNENDRIKLEQKLANLQGELDDELAFMNKHRDLLNSVRDEILLDEVESLQERFNKQRESLNEQVEDARQKGAEAANAYYSAYRQAQEEQLKLVKVQIDKFNDSIKWELDKHQGQKVIIDPKSLVGSGWSTGGYTGRGGVNEVAGVVHRGEYVVPASQVDQTTGTPKLATQNITINLSGILATSPQAKRELAQELQHALTQINQSRLS